MENHYDVQVAILHVENGGFWATVAELPGVFATGATHDELVECLNEAIEMYLEETGIPPELTEQRVQVQRFSLQKGGLIPA